MSIKEIESYREKYGDIPKDYMERLSYLFRVCPFTKEDINKLLLKIDKLMETHWETVTYVFYMVPTPCASKPPILFS